MALVTALALQADRRVIDVIVIGTALAVSDLFELRPANRAPIPLGFAVALVLLRAATLSQFVVIVLAAALVACILRGDATPTTRAFYFAELIAAGVVAGATFHLIMRSLESDSRTGTLVALTAAAISEIVIADLLSFARERSLAPIRARAADVAIVSSGILMAVGYGGLAGQGRLGLWGPALFSIPLLAAWYSFERLRRTRLTFIQTVEALGIAPELGALAPSGHVERVARIAESMGEVLGLSASDLQDLRTAAWLHHLGAVCLDDPPQGEQLDPSEVARAGSEMLRASHVLSKAGDIVASETALYRPRTAGDGLPASSLLGQVLKVASAYDELTAGDDAASPRAIEALYSAPAYVYDVRVLNALEEVLSARHG
jgi:hypothetical protein